MATMGAHRSTTPSDSCSAPTSPASQNISPSNSPELTINNVGGGGNNQPNGLSNASTSTNQHFNQSYSSPSYQNQQQANLLQHQLEQFRMTNDTEPGGYVVIIIYFVCKLVSNFNFFYS